MRTKIKPSIQLKWVLSSQSAKLLWCTIVKCTACFKMVSGVEQLHAVYMQCTCIVVEDLQPTCPVEWRVFFPWISLNLRCSSYYEIVQQLLKLTCQMICLPFCFWSDKPDVCRCFEMDWLMYCLFVSGNWPAQISASKELLGRAWLDGLC